MLSSTFSHDTANTSTNGVSGCMVFAAAEIMSKGRRSYLVSSNLLQNMSSVNPLYKARQSISLVQYDIYIVAQHEFVSVTVIRTVGCDFRYDNTIPKGVKHWHGASLQSAICTSLLQKRSRRCQLKNAVKQGIYHAIIFAYPKSK